MIVIKYTDTSIEAILLHIDRQLSRGDIVTLTKAQALMLASLATRREPVNV